MFEGHGVVLEGGMQVGLSEVAGVTRFGKQYDVGQAQAGDELCGALQGRLMRPALPGCVDETQPEQDGGGQCC